MKKIIDGFNCILLAIMFLITSWQIVIRFLPGEVTVWSEEVARFLFVWIVFLGAGTLMRDGEHIRISIITDRLSPTAGKIVRVISAVLIIPFVFFMTWGGYKNMIKQWNTYAPTVDWMRLGYVYLALVLSGIIMLCYLFRNLLRDFFVHPSGSEPSVGDSP